MSICKHCNTEFNSNAIGGHTRNCIFNPNSKKWKSAFSEFNILGFFAWKHEQENYKFIAIEQSPRSKSLKSLKIDHNTALVVGREVEGLSLVEIGLCDEIFEIPMIGAKESFNVAVSAGIALYQSSN